MLSHSKPSKTFNDFTCWLVHSIARHLYLKSEQSYNGKLKASASRKHPRTKVTPDFHLTYSKNGIIYSKNGVNLGIKRIKMNNFQYFSIKLYVVDPKHMILWRTYDNYGKNPGFL